ncbi:hypothetical protein E3N88_14247 [Mikania micrantha]|uniref:Uncharacterized protein n=1 Tax=Mikania micrantha TaxID=192012 RepID=A0A5N6P278_9ASTR|nr:hypothetical protein E3N88_14247 [Mikania micrantha]
MRTIIDELVPILRPVSDEDIMVHILAQFHKEYTTIATAIKLVNMSYTICGFATEANMLPTAISIQDMANVVWSILHCSDLQSGWPYGTQQWGLSGPNSTIQNYHAKRNALLTVRGVFNEDLSVLWMNATHMHIRY